LIIVSDLCDEPLIDRIFSVVARLGVFRALLDLGDDLTVNQLRILFRLYYRKRLTMSDIAAALGVSQPTATGVIDRLVDRSLVARTTDEEDRRRVVVVLTKEGRGRVDAMRCAGADAAWQAVERLSADEQQALFDALGPLHELLAKESVRASDGREG
jgi:DNA-binding MarR family transcriptional regulator